MRTAVALSVLLLATPAWAQPVDHAALGAEAFAAGRLDDAVRELEAAYATEPDPSLLFALGRVHSARGDCAQAVENYQRYLASQPGQKGTEAAQAEIDKCAAAAPPPVVAAPVVAAPSPRRAPSPPSFASAMVHDHVVQAGVVAGVVAGGLYLYARRTACWDEECGVDDGVDYAEYEDRRDLAPKLGAASAVVGGLAGALVLTGVIRFALRDDDDPRFEAHLTPTSRGGAVVVSGRF